MLFGIAAGTARQVDSGLSGWEELWIVVGGSIVAAVVLALVQLLWRKSHEAVLTIQCGDGFDFDKRVGNTDKAVAPAVEEHRALAAFAKFIRVAETRGRRGARNVVVRLKDVSPPSPHTSSIVELRFANSEEANDIRPHGHKNVFAQLVIFYESKSGEHGWRTTPTVLEHSNNPEFTLEIVVDGKRYSEARFFIENSWSNERIDALPGKEWPPSTLAFPTITPLEASIPKPQ